jgi:hypothetical protein
VASQQHQPKKQFSFNSPPHIEDTSKAYFPGFGEFEKTFNLHSQKMCSSFPEMENRYLNWFLGMNSLMLLVYDIRGIVLAFETGDARFSSLGFNLFICALTLSVAACSITFHATAKAKAVTAGLFILYTRMVISIIRQMTRATALYALTDLQKIKFSTNIMQGSQALMMWLLVIAFLCFTRIQNKVARTVFLTGSMSLAMLQGLIKIYELGFLKLEADQVMSYTSVVSWSVLVAYFWI